jgi:hypothetical protein
MQTEEEGASSSSMMMDLWSIFLYGMKAPMTREKYRGRLAKFFDFLRLESTIEERAQSFADRGGKDADWLFVNLLKFAQAQKERVERGELSPATLRNYIKAIKLFCEMNDISVPWKKITRGLSKARTFFTGEQEVEEWFVTQIPHERRIVIAGKGYASTDAICGF